MSTLRTAAQLHFSDDGLVLDALERGSARQRSSALVVGSIQQRTEVRSASGYARQLGITGIRHSLRRLIERGLAERVRPGRGEYTYWLTEEGVAVAAHRRR